MSDNKDLIAAKDILSQCNFTKLGTKTTEHPFFSPIKEEFDYRKCYQAIQQRQHRHYRFGQRNRPPQNLYNIYLLLDSNKREFSYDTFSFFSIKEVVERYNNFKKVGQAHICDIACRYYGMGHIIVLSWNSKAKTFILRRDGGANDYDRRDNYNFITKYNAASTPHANKIAESELFKTLKENSLEDLRELFINL